jgi:hypothetical protein
MSNAHYHITPRSANEKTGPIVVTTSAGETCPPACPFRRSCYAKAGPLALHWAAVTRGDRGDPWPAFLVTLAKALAKAPAGQVWRHNQAGDLPGVGDKIDRAKLAALVTVNAAAGAKGFTYTHKPLIAGDGDAKVAASNLAGVVAANAAGFTINASANTLAHADALADRLAGRVPVCVVVDAATPEKTVTPAGRRVVVCPAQTREGVTCATCRLCSRADRSVIVGFRVHGSGSKHYRTEVSK